jgi:hypothetical protein
VLWVAACIGAFLAVLIAIGVGRTLADNRRMMRGECPRHSAPPSIGGRIDTEMQGGPSVSGGRFASRLTWSPDGVGWSVAPITDESRTAGGRIAYESIQDVALLRYGRRAQLLIGYEVDGVRGALSYVGPASSARFAADSMEPHLKVLVRREGSWPR